MDLWLALVPFLLSIGLVYFALFQVLRHLFRRHPLLFVSIMIIMAPFGFVLAQVSSVLDLLWVLSLTPFYGVFILFIVSTTWMVRFYCSAFAVLMVVDFLFRMRTSGFPQRPDLLRETSWRKILKTDTFEVGKQRSFRKGFGRIRLVFSRGVRRYWTLAAAVILMASVAATLVSGSHPRNPTYSEAIQFIASDNTDNHLYATGNYTCANFADDFQTNALRAGYNCGYVTVFFPDGGGHALNCFNTTDRGIVYVEPQTDEVVTLNVGEVYAGSAWNLQVENATIAGFSTRWEP